MAADEAAVVDGESIGAGAREDEAPVAEDEFDMEPLLFTVEVTRGTDGAVDEAVDSVGGIGVGAAF